MQVRAVGDIQMIQVNQVCSIGGLANGHTSLAFIFFASLLLSTLIDRGSRTDY
jgi:hypothetical protein